MAVISIEKPIRKRHRTVMNFPRSTSRLGNSQDDDDWNMDNIIPRDNLGDVDE